jgi:pyruvate dehydrogenase E2 component (dihydrolipoyllysine-residue acetyltransferase)
MRLAIARRMVESKARAPHFYVETEIPMSAVLERIEPSAVGGAKPSVTAFLAHACARALVEHPRLNAVWRDDEPVPADEVNLGIAIALDDGLVAPALLGAEQLSVRATGEQLRDLVGRARSGRLKPAEISGATFTLSNLGMFDVTRFTAIIVPPQVAILATGKIVPRTVLGEGGVKAAPFLNATVSADHRAVDGADVAAFLGSFSEALQTPGEPDA